MSAQNELNEFNEKTLPSKPPVKPKSQRAKLHAMLDTVELVHERRGRVRHPETVLRQLYILLLWNKRLAALPPAPGSIGEAMERYPGLRRKVLCREMETWLLEALALVRANSSKPPASKPPGSPAASSRANAG